MSGRGPSAQDHLPVRRGPAQDATARHDGQVGPDGLTRSLPPGLRARSVSDLGPRMLQAARRSSRWRTGTIEPVTGRRAAGSASCRPIRRTRKGHRRHEQGARRRQSRDQGALKRGGDDPLATTSDAERITVRRLAEHPRRGDQERRSTSVSRTRTPTWRSSADDGVHAFVDGARRRRWSCRRPCPAWVVPPRRDTLKRATAASRGRTSPTPRFPTTPGTGAGGQQENVAMSEPTSPVASERDPDMPGGTGARACATRSGRRPDPSTLRRLADDGITDPATSSLADAASASPTACLQYAMIVVFALFLFSGVQQINESARHQPDVRQGRRLDLPRVRFSYPAPVGELHQGAHGQQAARTQGVLQPPRRRSRMTTDPNGVQALAGGRERPSTPTSTACCCWETARSRTPASN